MKTILTIILSILVFAGIAQIRYDTIPSGQTAVLKIGDEREILRYNDSGNDRYYESKDGAYGFNYYHLIPSSYSNDTVLTILATMTTGSGALLFERGSVRRGLELVVPHDSLYFGSYGSGALPVFNGAEVITDWTAHPTRPNIWVTATKTNSTSAYRTVVVIDGDRFLPVLFESLDADLEYCPVDSAGTVGDSIYVYSAINPSLRTAELSTAIVGIRDGLSPDSTSSHITIRNLDFRYYGYEGVDTRMTYAGGSFAGNWLIENCNFYFNKQGGVQFYQGHGHNTVRNCTATYNGNGFYSNISDSNSFVGNTITNTIEFSQGVVSESFTDGHAIGVFNSKGNIIESNYIEGDATGGHILGNDKGQAIVRYNEIHGFGQSQAGYNRTYLDEDMYYYYNLFYDHGTTSACFWTDSIVGTGKVYIYNNTFYSESTIGNRVIRLESVRDSNVIMKNNIYESNGLTYILEFYDSYPALTSDYNLWNPSTYYAVWNTSPTDGIPSTNATTLAAWQTASSQDANSISGDPLFTNVSTGDFTLQAESPAKNTGTPISGIPLFDIRGIAVSVTNPSMGAYE